MWVCATFSGRTNLKAVLIPTETDFQEERADYGSWPEGLAGKTTLCRSLLPFEEENGPLGGGGISVVKLTPK